MPSEKHNMLAGQLYDPSDPELVADRLRARLAWADDGWLGGGVGAVPAGVFAAGNPCRVIRAIA